MCLAQGGDPGRATPSSFKGMSGRPKGPTATASSLRWPKGTEGSPSSPAGRVSACPSGLEGDGGPVVPKPVTSPNEDTGKERGPGDPGERKGDASVTEVPDPEEIVERWKSIEPSFRGVEVPPKFAKVCARSSKDKRSTFDNLYPLLLDKRMYDLAYDRVKSNPGMMTPGTTEETLSGWGPELVERIISSLRNESFSFSTARSVGIPKPDGGTRTLRIASPRDKIVQRVLAFILEAIYDPSFYENSFGFRPGRGTHDALHYIKHHFQGARWVIEGDIAKCFDEIDHHLLISIIRKRIKDERFIRLIWKALRAGYLSDTGTPKDDLAGTPQGSIVSPVLCNIVLHEFDRQVLELLSPTFNRGRTRFQPKEYTRARSYQHYHERRFRERNDPASLAKAKEAFNRVRSLPSVDPRDPNFRRLTYARYADDWIIGFAGPRTEAEHVRDRCGEYLANLRLRLSPTKTVISKASVGFQFLGTNIRVPLGEQRFRRGQKTRATLGVRLNAPLRYVISKLAAAGYCDKDGVPKPRFALFAADKDEIVSSYSSVMRGILNFYSFADNYSRLSYSLFHILRKSAAKLLAAKYKLRTSRQVIKRFGHYLQGSDEAALPDVRNPRIRGRPFKLGTKDISRTLIFRRANLAVRAKSLECAACGSTFGVEMHHIRALKSLRGKTDPISFAMAARRRKQIPLCRRHHMAKHSRRRKKG